MTSRTDKMSARNIRAVYMREYRNKKRLEEDASPSSSIHWRDYKLLVNESLNNAERWIEQKGFWPI
jgi:hypothetical protein